jgi:lysophospholipase L1-like esterase
MFKRLFQKEPAGFDPDTSCALRQLGLALLILAVFALATYSSPALKRFQPWVPGEALPIVRLIKSQDESTLPAFAEAGPEAARDTATTTQSPKSVTASNRDRQASKPAFHTRIAPEELDGLTQTIADPGGRAMAPFYRALLRTAEKRPKAITRVAHFGDSAVAADSITVTMRRRMQTRFGDSGHGFILIAPGEMHYLHRDIRHRASADWNLYPIVLLSLGTDWYGYGGVQFRSTADSWARFSTIDEGDIGKRVSGFEVFYQRYPGGGKLITKLDNQPRTVTPTRYNQREDAWLTIKTTDGPHSLSIRTDGCSPVRLYGVVLERDRPGVVYDSLGMVGGRAERLLAAEHKHIQGQLKHRKPNLVILAFGGNEAENRWLDIARYERTLRKVVNHVCLPRNETACLLFAPLDQGERNERGKISTIAKLPEIVAVQRRVAREEGCAFFNTYEAMGGKNAMRAWYRQKPRLATSDFRHATAAGYERIGNMFYKAVLKGFADYLTKRKESHTSK